MEHVEDELTQVVNRKVGVFGDRRNGGEDRADENGGLDRSINFIRNQLLSIFN